MSAIAWFFKHCRIAKNPKRLFILKEIFSKIVDGRGD